MQDETGSHEVESPAAERDEGNVWLRELRDVASGVADVRRLVAERLSADEAKNEAFDRLYAELDRTKKHAAVLDNRSLYLDLLLFRDRLETAVRDASVEQQPLVESLLEELDQVLMRREIRPVPVGGDRFDSRYQLAVSAEAVDSAAEDGAVLRTLRGGFTCGDIVLRPQEVVVGRLKKNGPAAASSEPAAGD